jgi:hypothetical protein
LWLVSGFHSLSPTLTLSFCIFNIFNPIHIINNYCNIHAARVFERLLASVQPVAKKMLPDGLFLSLHNQSTTNSPNENCHPLRMTGSKIYCRKFPRETGCFLCKAYPEPDSPMESHLYRICLVKMTGKKARRGKTEARGRIVKQNLWADWLRPQLAKWFFERGC